METIFGLLLLFLLIGMFARSFNAKIRLLLIGAIIGAILLLYLT